MARTFGFDVLVCPRCRGRLRLIALIEEAAVIERILRHLGVPSEIAAARPARAPPLHVGTPNLPCGRRAGRGRVQEEAFGQLGHPSHASYRSGDPRVGIVIRFMVDAVCAGAMLTKDPITGDVRVIEAPWGLGESVVAGLVNPDRYRVSRSEDVLETIIGDTHMAVRADPAGHTHEAPVAKDLRRAACLGSERRRARRRMGVRGRPSAPASTPRGDAMITRLGERRVLRRRDLRHAQACQGRRCVKEPLTRR